MKNAAVLSFQQGRNQQQQNHQQANLHLDLAFIVRLRADEQARSHPE